MQPGGASVQGEDVTERGVCSFLHGGCRHITYSYACWTTEQIRISNSFFFGHMRTGMKFGESYFGGELQTQEVVLAVFSANISGNFKKEEPPGGKK